MRVTCFTIGQPAVGDAAFRRRLGKTAAALKKAGLYRFYRVRNDQDIVPVMPPIPQLGYVHCGRKVLLSQMEEAKGPDAEEWRKRPRHDLMFELHDAGETATPKNQEKIDVIVNKSEAQANLGDVLTDHMGANYLAVCEDLVKQHEAEHAALRAQGQPKEESQGE